MDRGLDRPRFQARLGHLEKQAPAADLAVIPEKNSGRPDNGRGIPRLLKQQRANNSENVR